MPHFVRPELLSGGSGQLNGQIRPLSSAARALLHQPSHVNLTSRTYAALLTCLCCRELWSSEAETELYGLVRRLRR